MSTLGWLILAVVLVLCWHVSEVCACFAVIVGRGASADGSVLVGHNEENHGRHVLNFRLVPSRPSKAGDTVMLQRGGSLDQVPQTAGFLWSENPGLEFSDGYLNQWGVAIVSNGCPSREDDYDALVARSEIRHGGIGYMLRRLVAQRARSAREGVRLAGGLVERFGYVASGRTYVIADPREAWLLAVVRGRRWVAQRVPDDAVVVLPNVHIIGRVNLEDSGNFLASADLIGYAAGRRWFDPDARAPFSFRGVYQTADRNGPDERRWWGQQLVTGRRGPWPPAEPMPFAVKPHRKMTVASLAAILRYNEGPRSLFHPNTQEMAVFQLRSGMPAEVGCVYWRTTGRPDASVLTPWYAGISETPKTYFRAVDLKRQLALDHHFNPPAGTFDPDPALAWWKFAALQDLIDQDHAERIKVVRPVWAALEGRLLEAQAALEKRVIQRMATDREAARAELTEYCDQQAAAACREAERLAEIWGQADVRR